MHDESTKWMGWCNEWCTQWKTVAGCMEWMKDIQCDNAEWGCWSNERSGYEENARWECVKWINGTLVGKMQDGCIAAINVMYVE